MDRHDPMHQQLERLFCGVRNERLLAGVLGMLLASVWLVGVGALLVFLISARGVSLAGTVIGVCVAFAICGVLPLHRIFHARRGLHQHARPGYRDPTLMLFAILLAPVLVRRNLGVLVQALRLRWSPHCVRLAKHILLESERALPVHKLSRRGASSAELQGTLFLLQQARLVRLDEQTGSCVRTLQGERLLQRG